MTETTKLPAVSVIVPLFNEEENVSILQSELNATLPGTSCFKRLARARSGDRKFWAGPSPTFTGFRPMLGYILEKPSAND